MDLGVLLELSLPTRGKKMIIERKPTPWLPSSAHPVSSGLAGRPPLTVESRWEATPARTLPWQGVEDLPQAVLALRGVLGHEDNVRCDEARSSSLTSVGYGFLASLQDADLPRSIKRKFRTCSGGEIQKSACRILRRIEGSDRLFLVQMRGFGSTLVVVTWARMAFSKVRVERNLPRLSRRAVRIENQHPTRLIQEAEADVECM
jgi:hypothetical protein